MKQIYRVNMGDPADRSRAASTVTRKKISDYDEFVAEIGEFGLWQKIICLLLWIPAMAGGVHVLMYSFTGLSPTNYRFNCYVSSSQSLGRLKK